MANVIELSALLHRLKTSDYEFASSLVSQWRRKGSLSPKQDYWVGKLIEKAQAATAPVPAAVVAPVAPQAPVAVAPAVAPVVAPTPAPVTPAAPLAGEFAKLFELFTGTGLVRPKLFLTTETGRQLRLTLAGPHSFAPGTINVAAKVHGGYITWVGRITKDGHIKLVHALSPPYSTTITDALKAFAADPEAIATAYGKATCVCCFCGRVLDDARSKEVGYGPVCARAWKLKWGKYDPNAPEDATPKKARKSSKVPVGSSEDAHEIAIW